MTKLLDRAIALLILLILGAAMVVTGPQFAHADASGSWSNWRDWSSWSTNPVSGSDSRQVETRQVPKSYDMEVYVCGNSKGVRSYLKYMQSGYTQRAHYKENWPADRVNSVKTVAQGSYWNGPSNVAGNVIGPGTGYLDQNQVPFFIVNTYYETQYRYRDRAWIPATYLVTFTDGQGNTLSSNFVEYGKAATAPVNPTRSGYTFAGWDKSFSNVTSVLTVNAKWTKNSDSGGGNTPITTQASIVKAELSGVSDAFYTGKAIAPKPTVKLNGKTLAEGTDYTLSYTNNVNIGTATITVTGKGKYRDTAKTTFKIKPVAVTKVSLDKTNLSLEESKSAALKATVAPSNATDKSLTWKSSNTKVATVDANGNVKAVGAGTATTTATSKSNGKASASCSVSVTKKADIIAPSADGTKTEAEAVSGADTVWKRKSGKTALDTMSEIVREGWAGGCGGVVFIATSANFPDALSASGAAGLFGAPILLVESNSLPAQTKSELLRIKPTRIIVVGGKYAVSDAVLRQIKAACGVNPERVKGSRASDTAAQLNRKLFGKKSTVAILATCLGFQDALSASPVAYAKHYPVFLVDGMNAISQATIDAMKACGIKQVIVVGGKYAVSESIVSKLKSNGITLLVRLKGATAYDTSNAIAKWAIAHGMKAEKAGVCTGKSYQDALCGSVLCGRNNAVILLVDEGRTICISDFVRNYCKGIRTGYIFGGKYAVSIYLYDALLIVCGCVVDNQNIMLFSSENGSKTFTQYDVTGDGIPDTVKITGRMSADKNNLVITVNGSTAFAGNCGENAKGREYGSTKWNYIAQFITVKLLRLANGTPFLYISLGSSADAASWVGYSYHAIVRYQGGKFVNQDTVLLGLTEGANSAYYREVEASGNYINTKIHMNYTGFGNIEHTRSYGFSKGKLNTDFGEVTFTMNGYPYVTLNKNVDAYKDVTKATKAATAYAGDRVKVTMIRHYKGKAYLKLAKTNGAVIGWIENPKDDPYESFMSKAVGRRTLFKEWTADMYG